MPKARFLYVSAHNVFVLSSGQDCQLFSSSRCTYRRPYLISPHSLTTCFNTHSSRRQSKAVLLSLDSVPQSSLLILYMYSSLYHAGTPSSSSPTSATLYARQKIRSLRSRRMTQGQDAENVDPSANVRGDGSLKSVLPVGGGKLGQKQSSVMTKRPSRSPLSIMIPEAAPCPPAPQTSLFNTHTPPKSRPHVPSPPKTAGATPRRIDMESWVAIARQRARQTPREDRLRLVASKILAMNSPRAMVRLPASEAPRPYVKSCLSHMIVAEA